MSRIGRLGQEFAEKIRNKFNSGAVNNQNIQRTLDTLRLEENQDTFERLTSNGTVLDMSLEMHEGVQETCEEYIDEYAYSPNYEQEHKQTIPREILNIIA